MTPHRVEIHTRFDARTSGCVAIDDAGAVQFFGAHAQGLFGYSDVDVVGQPLEMLLHPEDRAAHPAKRDAFLSAGSPGREMASDALALRGYRADGTVIRLRIRILNWRDRLRTAVLTLQPDHAEADVSDIVRVELLALDASLAAKVAPLPLVTFTRRDVGNTAKSRVEMGLGEAASQTGLAAYSAVLIVGADVTLESNHRAGVLTFTPSLDRVLQPESAFIFSGPGRAAVLELPAPVRVQRGQLLELHVQAQDYQPARDEVSCTLWGRPA